MAVLFIGALGGCFGLGNYFKLARLFTGDL